MALTEFCVKSGLRIMITARILTTHTDTKSSYLTDGLNPGLEDEFNAERAIRSNPRWLAAAAD